MILAILLIGRATSVLAQADNFAAEEVEISLQGGQVKTVPIALGSDPRDLKLWARLDKLPQGWPGKDLRIEIVSIAAAPEGRRLVLRVSAEHCCPSGSYDASFTIGAGEPENPKGGVATLPLKIRVTAGPVCAAAKIGEKGFVFLAILMWLYVRGMYFNCNFLSPDRLAHRLVPLRWNSHSQPEGVTGRSEEIRARIAAQLRLGQRLRAWLLANPLVFGLPWKKYEETVQLDLGRRHDEIHLVLMPHRETFKRLQSNPDDARGKLFASATPDRGAFIFGLPDRGGQIGQLKPDFASDQVAKVKPRAQLTALPVGIEAGEDLSKFAAGWQILG